MYSTTQMAGSRLPKMLVSNYLGRTSILSAAASVACVKGHGTLSPNVQFCPMCGAAPIMLWFAPFASYSAHPWAPRLT